MSFLRLRPISGGSDADDAAAAEAAAAAKAAEDAKAAAAYVPTEQFKAFEATITQSMQQLIGHVEGLSAQLASARATGRPDPKAEPLVTEAEIDEAASQGVGVGKSVLRRIKQTEERVARELQAVRQQGAQAIAQFARNQAVAAMPLYVRFKDELEQGFKGLDPAHIIYPEAYLTVYHMIVGQHATELTAEATKAALRQPRPEDDGGTGEPGQAGRVGGGTAKVPTVRELLGENAEAALRRKGVTGDEHARRLGYKSWADFAKVVQSQEVE